MYLEISTLQLQLADTLTYGWAVLKPANQSLHHARTTWRAMVALQLFACSEERFCRFCKQEYAFQWHQTLSSQLPAAAPTPVSSSFSKPTS
jgi:hypothetical protein